MMMNKQEISFLDTTNTNKETKNTDKREENNISVSTVDESQSFSTPKKTQESSDLKPIKYLVEEKDYTIENQLKNLNKYKNNINKNQIIFKTTENKEPNEDKALSDRNVKKTQNNINDKKETEVYDCSKNFSNFSLCVPSMNQFYDKFFEFKDDLGIIRDSYSRMQRDKVPNVFINHVMITQKNGKDNYSTYSVTTKTKKKMVNFVYYQPLFKK